MNELLNKTECAILKALAIVMIMVHNYTHLLRGRTPENEYTFHLARTYQLLGNVLHPDSSILLHLFSFLGHYGVPIFLFLSGYGLVKKYETSSNELPAKGRFIFTHYAKLLKLMLIGLLAFLVADYLHSNEISTTPVNFAAQITMIISLFTEPWTRVKPGPYWFFGLMFQLYVIYIFFLRADKSSRWHKWLTPLLFVMLCQVVMYFRPSEDALHWMRYNFLVAGLPFAAGLLVARYDRSLCLNRWLWLAIAIVGWAVVIIMNLRFILWLCSPVMVIVASVALVKALPASWHQPLVWVGGLSSMLFVIHPIVRLFLLRYGFMGTYHAYVFMTLYLILSFLFAIPYKWLLNQKWIIKKG